MTLGPQLVLACPHCDSLAVVQSFASGNTLGGVLWSDGWFHAPMMPNPQDILQCSGCGSWYWVADARSVGEMPWTMRRGEEDDSVPEAWKKARPVWTHRHDGHAEALAAGLGTTPERELHLRLRAWWQVNEPYRDGDVPPPVDANALRRLRELVRQTGGSAIVETAASHALGEPDAALDALSRTSLPESWAEAFRTLIEAGDRRVVRLTPPRGAS